jgi:uncharacterized protein (TIGR02453 family)
MTATHAFTGFPAQGLQFLQDLARDNNRDWFQAHKDDYLNFVLAPAQAFVVALGERLRSLSPEIDYDAKSGGGGSIMRIYRDVRFSKDKRPYNTHVGMVFWEGRLKRMENPGFFVGVEPTGAGVYVGQHLFSKPQLDVYRQAVVDEDLGSDLAKALVSLQDAGDYAIGGSHYKKVPPGYDPLHPRAELLKFNGLHASSRPIPPEQVQSPDFVEVCYRHCQNMSPLHRWLVAAFRSLSV